MDIVVEELEEVSPKHPCELYMPSGTVVICV